MASEVKRLLEEIEASYQAARRALTSPAIMAKHEFIQRRMALLPFISRSGSLWQNHLRACPTGTRT